MTGLPYPNGPLLVYSQPGATHLPNLQVGLGAVIHSGAGDRLLEGQDLKGEVAGQHGQLAAYFTSREFTECICDSCIKGSIALHNAGLVQ